MGRLSDKALGKDLFSPPKYPEGPGFKEHTTSKEAARRIAPTITKIKAEVIETLKVQGPSGLTPDQIAMRIDRSILAVRPRLTELHHAGLVERTGDVRRNSSGLFARVYRAKL